MQKIIRNVLKGVILVELYALFIGLYAWYILLTGYAVL